MSPENWIYPTAFHPCRLEITKNKSILYDLKEGKEREVKICSTERFATEGTVTILECDLIKSKNSSKDYLFVTSVEKVRTVDVSPTRTGIKFELGRSLLYDKEFVDVDADENTFILRVPPLFHASEIDHVISVVIPDFYAEAYGVRFFRDSTQ